MADWVRCKSCGGGQNGKIHLRMRAGDHGAMEQVWGCGCGAPLTPGEVLRVKAIIDRAKGVLPCEPACSGLSR